MVVGRSTARLDELMAMASGKSFNILDEQLSFLESACALYDNADHAAAKKIAAILIALLDDSKDALPAAALLAHDREYIGFNSFIDTACTGASGFLLCWTGVDEQQSTEICYTPKLGYSLPWYKTSFANWWNNEVVINEVVVPNDYHITFSRHKLCLFLQDKNEQAPHEQDAEMEPFFASIRHIAFEFLGSMREYYSKSSATHSTKVSV